ncbi:MAG: hypothetical protein GX379_09335 [Clostridiales bacterium]|jgi:uncharacterized protein YjdB|nr:hypothetical protein [Clostridiales bacterium]
MKKRLKYAAYILAGIALFSAILITKDKIAEAANRVYLNETDLTLELGHYRTLKVRGTNEKVYWKSGNDRAATVASNGRVTARGWGSTRIYAYVGNKTLSTKVTIVQMNKKKVTLAENQTTQLALWGSDNSTTWKSSNEKVATVSDNGLVTGISTGTATITATFKGKKITSEVSVIGLNHESFVLEYGGRFSSTRANFGTTKKLAVIGSKDKITWSSSDTSVATVDSKGKVKAKGPGTATIFATVNGQKIASTVKVLQMNNSQVELKIGQDYSLDVLGTDSDILWRSTNKNVVTVSDDGVMTAKGKGSAKVIAEVDGRLVRCIVTVK